MGLSLYAFLMFVCKPNKVLQALIERSNICADLLAD